MKALTWSAPLRGIAVLASLLVMAPTATSSPTAPAADGEWNFRVLLDGKEVESVTFLPHPMIKQAQVKDCYPAVGK